MSCVIIVVCLTCSILKSICLCEDYPPLFNTLCECSPSCLVMQAAWLWEWQRQTVNRYTTFVFRIYIFCWLVYWLYSKCFKNVRSREIHMRRQGLVVLLGQGNWQTSSSYLICEQQRGLFNGVFTLRDKGLTAGPFVFIRVTHAGFIAPKNPCKCF